MKKDVVTASEIGDYVYCQWCWWKHTNGLPKKINDRMESGTKKHNALFLFIYRIEKLGVVLKLLLLIGIGLVLLSLFLKLFFL